MNAVTVPVARAMMLAIVAATALQHGTSAQDDSAQRVVVRGRVLSAGDSQPLANARVMVQGAEGDPIFTALDGTFTVGVPSSFRLRITKAGYAPAVATGTVAAARELEVRLARGAVLAGFVLDELGFPVTDARIRARWVDAAASEYGLSEFVAETDDAGEYRIGSLPAGSYTVNTEPAPPRLTDTALSYAMMAEMQQIRRAIERKATPLSDLVRVELRNGEETPLTLMHHRRAVVPADAPIAGAVEGVVLDELGQPVEGVTVRALRVKYVDDRSVADPAGVPWRTDDRGRYRLFHLLPGRYLVSVSDDAASFAPVYYPGTTAIGGAAALVIGRNAEVVGTNIHLTRAREATLEGLALNAQGAPLEGTVTLMTSRRSGATTLPPRSTRTDPAGGFEFANVPPGEYVLRATRAPDANTRLQAMGEVGFQFVTVEGPAVPLVTIATVRTATLTGRMSFEGDASRLGDGVLMTAVPDADQAALERFSEARNLPDGTFELRGLAGVVRLVARTPPGWWVKSITVGGTDVTDEQIRFTGPADSRADVEVVIASGTSSLAGQVTDDAGRAPDDYRVIVFSSNPQRWFGRSPYVRLGFGPEADGGFTVADIPPGDYLAVAVDALDGDASVGEWQNPEVLGSLAGVASRVSLAQGQRATTRLRLVKR